MLYQEKSGNPDYTQKNIAHGEISPNLVALMNMKHFKAENDKRAL
jgi:hypothetical protein